MGQVTKHKAPLSLPPASTQLPDLFPQSAGLPASAQNICWKPVWKNNKVFEDMLVDTREFLAIQAADSHQARDLLPRFRRPTTAQSRSPRGWDLTVDTSEKEA